MIRTLSIFVAMGFLTSFSADAGADSQPGISQYKPPTSVTYTYNQILRDRDGRITDLPLTIGWDTIVGFDDLQPTYAMDYSAAYSDDLAIDLNGDDSGFHLDLHSETRSSYFVGTGESYTRYWQTYTQIDAYIHFTVDVTTAFMLEITDPGEDGWGQFSLRDSVAPGSGLLIEYDSMVDEPFGQVELILEAGTYYTNTSFFQGTDIIPVAPSPDGPMSTFNETSASFNIALTAVPAPGTLALLPFGLVAACRRR